MTNTTFLAPTKRAIEMRIKLECKRNPIFDYLPKEAKDRFVAMSEAIYKLLNDLEGFPQDEVDAVLDSEEFWTAMSCSVKVSNPAMMTTPIMKAVRNVIADLCA